MTGHTLFKRGHNVTPADLKSLRARLGWSQSRLAERLGVTRNTVNRWEMGLHPIAPMAILLLRTIKLPK